MIEISFAKLVLLALVALIVLGPEKLPGAARTAGALLRRVRNGWDSVRAEVERELEVEEIKRAAREAAAQAEAAQSGFKDGVQQVRAPLDEAVATLQAATAPEPGATAAPESESEPVASEPDPQQELPLAAPPPRESAHGGH